MPVAQMDCRELMAGLDARSIDAVVTDPPYELGFMGKGWDRSGIAYDVDVWREVLRVLKPGGHLVAFGGSRTYHRLACAIEDAGFEIRDQLQWLYGSGFPKSLDVSKAMDKAAGVEREVVGPAPYTRGRATQQYSETRRVSYDYPPSDITAPATDLARQWDGWGTALKPAHEPIVLARKPLIGTVAANVAQHGTGALNIDGCRIESNEANPSIARRQGAINHLSDRPARETEAEGRMASRQSPEAFRAERAGELLGRWPANVVLDEEAGALLDQQSGERKSGGYPPAGGQRTHVTTYGRPNERGEPAFGASSGGASRFFYCAKASRSERNAGLEGMPEREQGQRYGSVQDARPHTVNGYEYPRKAMANTHPTVKPIALMRWLVRLITPAGGLVLDPFMGSGSTGCAAVLEGFRFTGCDLDAEYVEIARRRIAHHGRQSVMVLT